MARILWKFRLALRSVETWACLISVMLVVFNSAVDVSGEDQSQKNDSEQIADGCPHDPTLWANVSYQRGNRPVDRGKRDLTFGERSIWNRLIRTVGNSLLTRGPLNSTESGQLYRIYLNPRSISARGNDSDVYAVSVMLQLFSGDFTFGVRQLDESRPSAQLMSEFEGLFSNRTGRFCATFCAGGSHGEQAPIVRRGAEINFTNPAAFFNRSANPETLLQRDCKIHIKFDIPMVKTIASPLVSGLMTSLRLQDDPLYFRPVPISGQTSLRYEYNSTVQKEAHISGDDAKPDISSTMVEKLKLWSEAPPFCAKEQRRSIFLTDIYPLLWNSSCSSSDGNLCSPFQNVNVSRVLSSAVTLASIECSIDWKVSAEFQIEIIQWTNFLNESNADHSSFATMEFVLLAEGYWNFYKPGQLIMVAHYLASDGTPLDTRIQITLQIPTVQTLHHRYGLVGHIRSLREANDSLYFASFGFVGDFHFPYYWFRKRETLIGSTKSNTIDRWSTFKPVYSYNSSIESKIEPVCSAAAKMFKKFPKRIRFPDGSRASDLEFAHSVMIPDPSKSSHPGNLYYFDLASVAINQNFYDPFDRYPKHGTDPPQAFFNPSEIPVSFRTFLPQLFEAHNPLYTSRGNGYLPNFNLDARVEAEGYYKSGTGHLCMLGCRRSWESVAAPYEEDDATKSGPSEGGESCDIVFSIQYPPTNPSLWAKSPVVAGNISSLLDADHPLYFKPMALNTTEQKFYFLETKERLLRRNTETIMSLVASSLAAFFIAFQLRHSSRESSFKNLKFVSFLMLAVLTSGHFIPLLLSFNALWSKSLPSRGLYFQSMPWSYYAWQETREVITRGTSMVAFLLELRLLQLVWRSRARTTSPPLIHASGKVTESVVLKACLPIYAVMIVIVACVHWQLGPHQHQYQYLTEGQIGQIVWADVQAFSGVILDLFLLPQVIANVLWDTDKKVAPLRPLFYVGMTLVRSVAHLFDAARAWNFIPDLEPSMYFYANPNWDLYSTTWDVIIPCCATTLAGLLFLQQRFGGRCFIPKRSQRTNREQIAFLDEDL